MGRRSINTTKSGKYMNPTDQARKEARKKELKKNKKQRQMVRAAVLKGKDPMQIILEMEKMDVMEFDVECHTTLSEKVLKEKRKKLKETLDRVMKMYEKENPEYWVEIRRMEADYEKKRQTRIEYYEAVRHAQSVTVDEIPLPNFEKPSHLLPDTEQPIGDSNYQNEPIHGILKKAYVHPALDTRKPPGCPPLLMPTLSQYEEDADFSDLHAKDGDSANVKAVHFVDDQEGSTRSLKSKNRITGQDIDDFMRESEVLFNEKILEKSNISDDRSSEPRSAHPLRDAPNESTADKPGPDDIEGANVHSNPSQQLGQPPIHGIPPHLQGPIRPPSNLIPLPRLPLGLPPHRLPIGMRPPMRPPFAPPGPLPHGMIPKPLPLMHSSNVLTAKPQLIVRPRADDARSSATIEAKPQIRNLSADVTRFLPTSLRVKREDKKRTKQATDGKEGPVKVEELEKKPTKDDAYSQFMQEMEGLL